jgi:hypothetical protein
VADVFQTSLGNIPPNAKVTITVTYVSELFQNGNVIRFVAPIAVLYKAPTLPTITSLLAFYGLQLRVDIEMSSNIVAIVSPKQQITQVRKRLDTLYWRRMFLL